MNSPYSELRVVPDRPGRMSPELSVSAPPGTGNDYAALLRGAVERPIPLEPISVVFVVGQESTRVESIIDGLVHQTYPTALVDLVLVHSSGVELPDLDATRPRFRGLRIVEVADGVSHPRELCNAAMASNLGTRWVLALDAQCVPAPILVERMVRSLAGHDRVVCFGDVRSDPNPDDLRFDPHPFLSMRCTAVGFARDQFFEIGTFDATLGSVEAVDIEWAYRAWNRGNYIVPLASTLERSGSMTDGGSPTPFDAHLASKCPVGLTRGEPSPDDVPLVSIYIPLFNAAGTIVEAIESALGQTVFDLEVCVVDDGSTDGSGVRVRDAFANEPRVRMVAQENLGIGHASNRALSMCRAPFIGQLDSDDRLKPTAVEETLAVLQSDPEIGVVYSSNELIDGDGKRVGDGYEFPHYSRHQLLYLMIVHHFRLFRARDWYRTTGFATDMKNAVDYDMFLKLSEVTEMVHLPSQLYQYRKHTTSTSQAAHGTQRANHRMAVQRALDRRGLSAEWDMAPRQPIDPREYEFERRADGARHFGRSVDTVRLSLAVGWDRDAAVESLQRLFPTWRIEKRRRLGEPRVESPPLSHARAIRAVEPIAEHFPRDAIRLVYA